MHLVFLTNKLKLKKCSFFVLTFENWKWSKAIVSIQANHPDYTAGDTIPDDVQENIYTKFSIARNSC